MQRASIALALACSLPIGQAQEAVPPPAWARSVRALRPATAVYPEPRVAGPPRGQLWQGHHYAFLRRVFGKGCREGIFFELAPQAYVCAEEVEVARELPEEVPEPAYRYAIVRRAEAPAYTHLSHRRSREALETLPLGFGVALIASVEQEGERYAQTWRGRWIREKDLRLVEASRFHGLSFEADAPRAQELAGRASELSSALRGLKRLPYRAPPSEIAANERWIDIDLATQTLIAYEGERVRLITRVSTGRSPHRTPKGLFRIQRKLRFDDMDNLADLDAETNYFLAQIPWVQYFSGPYALHAVFWHDRFGSPKSRGCINLAPADAAWLFAFTSPQLPKAWQSVGSARGEKGTRLRIR